MKYRKGYKYQLHEDYYVMVGVTPHKVIMTDFAKLNPDGMLTIYEKYAWDGASGPAIDSKSSMIASLEHDCLSQMMREELLDRKHFGEMNDRFYAKLVEEGMWKWRARIWRWAVRKFGKRHTKGTRKVYEV